MSRSYRKPIITCGQDQHKGNGRTSLKKTSNRKLRRKLKDPVYGISDGKAYKNGHSLESWDICDYKFRKDKPILTYHAVREEYKYDLKWHLKAIRK